MDHPLRDETNKLLRQRVIQHLKRGYSVKRDGNIIFVCGGNEPTHMRPMFNEYCRLEHPDLELFQPEFAMKDYFSAPGATPFDLGKFEELIAELSHAIVLFPEAAGSFAEAGYFALTPKLVPKTILALDQHYQGKDSFISMGPARVFGAKSRYHGVMQVAYAAPDFSQIVERLTRYSLERNRKELTLDRFVDLSSYDLFCVISKVVDLLGIATIDDVLGILRGAFAGTIRPTKVKELMSVLVGSRYLEPVGGYGHYRLKAGRPDLLPIRDSSKAAENAIRLELAAFYPTGSADFLAILETPHAP